MSNSKSDIDFKDIDLEQTESLLSSNEFNPSSPSHGGQHPKPASPILKNPTSSSSTVSPIDTQNITYSYTIDFENEVLFIDTSNWRYSNLLKLQILSCYGVFILFGLADQTLGTLIPLLQTSYNIGDTSISLVFLCMIAGYFIMAVLNEFSHKLIGVKGVTILGAIGMTLGYLIISTKPPYLIFLLSYLIGGIGFGSLDAAINSWMGNLVDSNQILGILHGCYGIGCMISPPLITYLLERENNPMEWNQYYILLSIIGCICVVALIFTFKFETAKKFKYINIQKHLHKSHDNDEIEVDGVKLTDFSIEIDEHDEDDDSTSSLASPPPSPSDEHSASLVAALKSKLVWLFAIILFVYVGGEVAFGSWMITFLLRIKKLSYKQSSYIATTFWTGLTLGRIVLGFITAHYFKTELMANFIYIIFSTVGYFIFYFISLIPTPESSTTMNTNVAIILLYIIALLIGIFVGPIFPTTIISALKVLPTKYHTSGIGFICAFGGGGAAGIPFLIGLIAEASEFGLQSLPLIVAILFTILTAIWFGITLKFNKTYGKNVI
ncbi:major facilitator superfamily domain-containing protein [Scheffersomyces coipomensis]|uniref:major facilitator superfamily domain-containing protein n=1 Tax=Scheffersomyces coipomensis TaxID=1788519 RepID=UPI00315C635C